VTFWVAVPAFGAAVGVANANVPATDADPPVSEEDASVWPYVIAPATGVAVTVGKVLPASTEAVVVFELNPVVSVGVKVTE